VAIEMLAESEVDIRIVWCCEPWSAVGGLCWRQAVVGLTSAVAEGLPG